MAKPTFKPFCPSFSSGPCPKRPGFNEFKDTADVLGRSHRAGIAKKRINKSMEDTLRILGCPPGYKAGIVPASDTGAFEMIMWGLLGERHVDVVHFESFGSGWYADITKHLKLQNVSEHKAAYGELPDLSRVNSRISDVVFTWNGTTSGVRVPNADWIAADREGLSICDATSAAFAMELPWDKLDITTFSWQKALGGEAGHGVIVFSPRALERIRKSKPLRPLPKIFRLAGKVVDDVCAGNVINTVSMMCVEDYNKCLTWVDSVGGLKGTVARTNANYKAIADYVAVNDWVSFLAGKEVCRSTTSVCLTLKADKKQVKSIISLIEKAGAGFDIGAYRDAPAGLRVWCGCTVDTEDVRRLMQWLGYAYAKVVKGSAPAQTPPLPFCPQFSSGPCKKPPVFDWYYDPNKVLGRSHRAGVCKERINHSMKETLRLLGCPPGYKAGIVPASDTGAYEMIMWGLLGERPVDVFHFESFGTGWHTDIVKHLKLPHVNSYKAGYGALPELSCANPLNDVVFTWNGTTSGVRVPNADWIASDREGLTICDATSAAFAMDLPWDKLDITTFSWQKALGGEAGHGVIVFSPRALERIRKSKPLRPLPKIFRLGGKVVDDVCAGNVINTISMMCVEDYNKCLEWVDSLGGLKGTIARTDANYQAVADFVADRQWIDFLCKREKYRSTTSVTLTVALPGDKVKKMLSLLDKEKVAFDMGAYRDAPAGLRIWCGCTVEKQDVEMMLTWLEWAYHQVKDAPAAAKL